MWLCGMIKLRTTNLLCLIASYIGYWQIHPPQKWIIYDNLYFPALCHSTQKDQEPGRRVKMPSLLSMLSRPQLTESLCTALVLSLLPAVSEIIPHVPGRISDGAWKWLSCTAGWWSEGEGKKGFIGEKASNGKTIFCTYFLNSPAILGVYYGVTVGTAIPSWACGIFCTLKIAQRTLRALSVTSQGQILLWWLYWWQWDMGTCNSQKSTKALQKSCIDSSSHVFSSHALSTSYFHGISAVQLLSPKRGLASRLTQFKPCTQQFFRITFIAKYEHRFPFIFMLLASVGTYSILWRTLMPRDTVYENSGWQIFKYISRKIGSKILPSIGFVL